MTHTLKHLSSNNCIIEEKQFIDVIEMHDYIDSHILEIKKPNDRIIINDRDVTEIIKDTEYYQFYYQSKQGVKKKEK